MKGLHFYDSNKTTNEHFVNYLVLYFSFSNVLYYGNVNIHLILLKKRGVGGWRKRN
jgi:hypothetical protein